MYHRDYNARETEERTEPRFDSETRGAAKEAET